MAETIKCTCSHCGAKYRLPVEAQGRTARCKRCGDKFAVPRVQSLEDTVLSWLVPEDAEDDDSAPAPKVISMPQDDGSGAGADAARKMRGPIRLKPGEEKADSEAQAGSR